MDIQVKIKELEEKIADCDKRVSELKLFKADLILQRRRWQRVLNQANKIDGTEEKDGGS